MRFWVFHLAMYIMQPFSWLLILVSRFTVGFTCRNSVVLLVMCRLFWVTFLMTCTVNSLQVQPVFRTLFFAMVAVLTFNMPTPVCELSTFVKLHSITIYFNLVVRWYYTSVHIYHIYMVYGNLCCLNCRHLYNSVLICTEFMVHVCFFQTMVCGPTLDYTTHVCVFLTCDILKQLVLIAFWIFNMILSYFNGTE